MSGVSLDWLANIEVKINNFVIQAPTFGKCAIFGVFPSASKPVGWGSNLFKSYQSYDGVSLDFGPALQSAITAENWVQVLKYRILLKSVEVYFLKSNSPKELIVSFFDNTTTINYGAQLKAVADAVDFYAFYVADQMTTNMFTDEEGIFNAVNTLQSLSYYKFCIADTSDTDNDTSAFCSTLKASTRASPRVMIHANTNNVTRTTPTSDVGVINCQGANFMGAYFSTIFNNGVGIKPAGGQQLDFTSTDPKINTGNIGNIGDDNTKFVNVNANVYPTFGSTGVGLLEYGTMISSTRTAILYADQIVGADFIKLTCQTDLATYIITQQAKGGVPYNDTGILALVEVFKNSLQKAVDNGILNQFNNSDISFVDAANVLPADKSARIYKGLSAEVVLAGNIQRISVVINANLK